VIPGGWITYIQIRRKKGFNMVDLVKSLILSCDISGTIREVVCNRFPEEGKGLTGKKLSHLVDQGSVSRVQVFLDSVRINKSIFNFEMNTWLEGKITPLSFGGIRYDDQLIIIVTNEKTVLNDLFEKMAAVNNEQANRLRQISKEAVKAGRLPGSGTTDDMLDQVSRLNNELVNMQRELSGKNSELLRLNEKLREKSIKDLLTGLYNRRYFYEKVKEEFVRAQRLDYSIVLASMDIDNFKSVNDNHGHEAGDKLLIEFSEILRKSLRKSFDSAYRFGGDEFTMLLLNCDSAKAQEILEKINKKLVRANNEVSISYGITDIPPDAINDIEKYLKIADQRMYSYKKHHSENIVR
jgi:diguanylate cyclase (GGDEF)-like protein